MKLAIVTNGESQAILDHTKDNSYEIGSNIEGVVVDSPLVDVSAQLPVINSSIGIKNLILDKNLFKEMCENYLHLSKEQSAVSLFTLFNGSSYSDFLEVSYSTRFMSGNVGPEVGFVMGTALKVEDDVLLAIPQLVALREMLTKLDYRGELYLEISKDYLLTKFLVGHFYGHFYMFCELGKNSVQENLEFCFGKFPEAELHGTIGVSNLVTQPPFPYKVQGTTRINAPDNAEKHLWRILFFGSQEGVLITTHGGTLQEARRRCFRTIANLRSYSDFIQYRNDFSLHDNFVFSRTRYEELSHYVPLENKKPDVPQV